MTARNIPVDDFAWYLKLVIRILAGLLMLAFAYLKLQNIILPIAQKIETRILLEFALCLYFTCWVVGANFDTDFQEKAYVVAPDIDWIPMVGLSSAIAALFAIMCCVTAFWQFAMLLAALWGLNYYCFQFILKMIRPVVNASKETYRAGGQFAERAKLDLVEEFMLGSWQQWRFAFGGLLIVGINILELPHLASRLGAAIGGLDGEFVVALSILAFIVLMEGWIWFMRLRCRIARGEIKKLAAKYQFVLKVTS